MRSQKRKMQTKVHAANEDFLQAWRQVTEKCPECGHMLTYSKEAQTGDDLRNAEQGSTIFYT
ncbi:hypothetical protein FKP32DRAFT_1690873, partial [Trametes sanguinea]